MMSNISRQEISAIWILVSLWLALPVRADLIAYEPFDYADGDLRNEDGGEGDWLNAWHQGQGFGSGDTWQVGQPSLSYTDSGGRTLPTAGGAVHVDGETANAEFREARPWETDGHVDEGDQVWFSLLFNRGSDVTRGAHFWILGSAGLGNGIGLFFNPTNVGARIDVSGAVNSEGHKTFTVGEDHLVVGRITFSDLMEDEVRFWLDPELDAIPLDTAANSGATSAAINTGSLSGVYMRHIAEGTDRIDEIRIGTDFFSVVGAATIPEPSSLVFAAVAGSLALVGHVFRVAASAKTVPRRR
jgi:hypothetical protein